MVSVSCFDVRVLVMFHVMFVHYTFSSVWVAEWPPFWKIAARSVSNLFLLYFVYLLYLFISRLGFKSGICLLIAPGPVPVHCFSFTFTMILAWRQSCSWDLDQIIHKLSCNFRWRLRI